MNLESPHTLVRRTGMYALDPLPSLKCSLSNPLEALDETRFSGALRTFKEEGCLLLEDAYPAEKIERLYALWSRHFRKYLEERGDDPHTHQDALRVGHRRWMLPGKICPPFDDEELFAHPFVNKMMDELLGPEKIISSFGSVVALPHAKEQHQHQDLPALFGSHPVHAQLPCFAVTMFIPLIDFNEQHGTTRIRPRSHLVSEEKAGELEGFEPEIPRGSCLLMDYRLHHGGTANLSSLARPMLFLVYSCPWFRDYRNFKKLPPLTACKGTLRKFSPALRAMLCQAELRGWFR